MLQQFDGTTAEPLNGGNKCGAILNPKSGLVKIPPLA